MSELYTVLVEIMEGDYNGEYDEAGMIEVLQCTASTFGLQFDQVEYFYQQVQGV